MAESLLLLESSLADLLHALAKVKDMRPSPVVGTVFRCGKPLFCRAGEAITLGGGSTGPGLQAGFAEIE